MEVTPWASTLATDSTTVLQRCVSVERLGSRVVLQMELLAVLQRAKPPLRAGNEHRIFLQASFSPNTAEGEGQQVLMHAGPWHLHRSQNAVMKLHCSLYHDPPCLS